MIYDTLPAAEVAAWWKALPADQQEFFRAHDMGIPFAFYGYPGGYVDAALANRDIRENMQRYPWVYTEQSERRSPTMRWEFEAVVAFGGLEIMNWGKNKTGWGPLRWVAPLLPDDPIDTLYLSCIHNPDKSLWYRRYNQRHWLRHKLGRKHCALVGWAMRWPKGKFIETVSREDSPDFREEFTQVHHYHGRKTEEASSIRCSNRLLPRQSAAAIRRKLRMDLGEFWRTVRCKVLLTKDRMREPQKTFWED